MVLPRHIVHKCPKDKRPDPGTRRYWTCPECGLEWEAQHVWPRPWRPTWRPARHPDYGYILYDANRYYHWNQRQWAQRRAKERAKQERKRQ